jgi:hypothetical protein
VNTRNYRPKILLTQTVVPNKIVVIKILEHLQIPHHIYIRNIALITQNAISFKSQKKKNCCKFKCEEIIFFLDSRKPHPPKSTLCGPRWASKTPAVPSSYKRCTPWLELETCCVDLKSFAITLRPLRTQRNYIAFPSLVFSGYITL